MAAEIESRLAPFASSIGAPVPAGFARYARVAHGDSDPGASGVPTDVLVAICDYLVADPDSRDCVFALCDVHGWTGASVAIGWPVGVPIDRAWIRQAEAEARKPAFGPGILKGPKLNLPCRDYMLFDGPVDAALAFPDYLHLAVGPDMLRPRARTWFVATDVDLDFTYVGGGGQLVDDLAADDRLAVEVLARDAPLEPDNDQ